MKIYFLILIVCIIAGAEKEKTCREKLHDIIPRFADDVKSTTSLHVTYLGGREVKCGNYISFFNTLFIPTIKFDVGSECRNMNVTVLFIGIPYNFYDTDMLVVGYPYLHWLVYNVPEQVLKQEFYGQVGDTKTDYFPPINPFSDHQYTFMIYCQRKNEYIEVKEKADSLLLDRPSFQPKDLAKKYGFGDPLAINYFISSLVNDAAIPPDFGNNPIN